MLTALPFLGVPCDERGVEVVLVLTDAEAAYEDDPRLAAPHRLAALPGDDTAEVEGHIQNKGTQHYCTKNNSTYASDDGAVKVREVGEVQRRHGEQLMLREASLVD